MALTCSCRQCGHEVPAMDLCQVCGAKLNMNQAHMMWRIVRQPVKDWMCWNAVMRIVLPVFAAVLLLAAWIEVLSGGVAGVEALISGGLLTALGIMLAAVLVVVLIVLALQGKELLVCTVDGKGVHIERYLPDANAVKLLARMKPPAMLAGMPKDGPRGLLTLGRQDVAWKQVARVQLWVEKNLVIFYAPAWWQVLALPCGPVNWNDTLQMIRQKIGKKKNVKLPKNLREEPAARSMSPRPARASNNPRPFEGMERDHVM